jgi:hypothetical protein
MPDGDSLNWKVRGKNSRRVLGLVRSGADPRLIGQEAGRMLVNQAKAGAWIAPIRDVTAIVVAEFDPESIQDSARRIRESAGQVVREHRGDGVGWMLPAVERTVSMLERKGHSPTEADIRGEFMSAACQSLIDHRVLQPARQEIAKESGRDRSEQIPAMRRVHVMYLKGDSRSSEEVSNCWIGLLMDAIFSPLESIFVQGD